MVMKRWRARAKGRPGRINKFLTNVTIKVSEDQVKEVKKEKAK
jgi:ribosomal protein L22